MHSSHRTYYRVADHLFAVESSEVALLSAMVNYEPFRIDSTTCDTSQAIFTLRIAQKGLLTDEQRAAYQHVFTDQSEEDMPRIEVYRASGWLMRVSPVAQAPICSEMECSADFSSGTLHIDKDCLDIRFCIDNALMLIYAFRTAPLMTLEMHAAVVVRSNEEKAYMFLGHSGTGKSTHARMWLQAFGDAYLLNDDNPILRVMDDGKVWVYGSPWSGKTPCYKSERAHVGAIVKLSQAPHNHLRTLSLPEAYAYTLSSASGLKIEKQMADCLYESIRHVITHVGCYHMECLPNVDAAEKCWKAINS